MQKIRVYRYRDSKFNVVSKYLDSLCRWVERYAIKDLSEDYVLKIECIFISVDEYVKLPTI